MIHRSGSSAFDLLAPEPGQHHLDSTLFCLAPCLQPCVSSVHSSEHTNCLHTPLKLHHVLSPSVLAGMQSLLEGGIQVLVRTFLIPLSPSFVTDLLQVPGSAEELALPTKTPETCFNYCYELHWFMFRKMNNKLGEMHMVLFRGISTRDEILCFRTVLAKQQIHSSASERNELITSTGSPETSPWFWEVNILDLNVYQWFPFSNLVS